MHVLKIHIFTNIMYIHFWRMQECMCRYVWFFFVSETLQWISATGDLYSISDDPRRSPVPKNRPSAGPPGHGQEFHSGGHCRESPTGKIMIQVHHLPGTKCLWLTKHTLETHHQPLLMYTYHWWPRLSSDEDILKKMENVLTSRFTYMYSSF